MQTEVFVAEVVGNTVPYSDRLWLGYFWFWPFNVEGHGTAHDLIEKMMVSLTP